MGFGSCETFDESMVGGRLSERGYVSSETALEMAVPLIR
jgi:hypothetical protein